jgi:hypothetical protein
MTSVVTGEDAKLIPVRLGANVKRERRGDTVATNVQVFCGYTPLPNGGYLSGFRVIISDEMDVTLGGIICATPNEAVKVAESSANAYLTLLVTFGVITAEDMAHSWFEAISPN